MPFVSPATGHAQTVLARPLVGALFAASCLLSIVSFYTTQQGMTLYLSPWLATLAALGIQSSLVLVAWLVGIQRGGRALLIAVYAITATVSIAFSYVSIYNWFSAHERPALMRRALYDELTGLAARAGERIEEAASKAAQNLAALEEMTEAERRHGYISRAPDADPALNAIRESVAREVSALGASYREGAGEGARYTAFDRHTKLMRVTLAELQAAQRTLAAWRAESGPGQPSDQQLRRFHAFYDSLPWTAIARASGAPAANRPPPPSLSQYLDTTGSGQEDLMQAFRDLFASPTSRHIFALTLAAFIDAVIFLLAFSSGPYLHGNEEDRHRAAAAALDATEEQVFVRGLLRKTGPGGHGLAQVEAAALTPGEQHFCLSLAQRGLAVVEESSAGRVYLFDRDVHGRLLDSLAQRGLPLRAASRGAAAGL
ncbi:MAG: hypothetical protein IT164_18385 [Bryobacterales bacterium]|nr:hypothetical protein [Bryobacterales bacterium]